MALGRNSGRSIPSRVMSSSKARMYSAVNSVSVFPAACACWMIRSSTSVMLMTSLTRYPLYLRVRRSRSDATSER